MRFERHAVAAASLLALLAGCASNDDDAGGVNTKPAFVGTVTTTAYDGVGDDLLTAGVGKSGLLAGGALPILSATPTAAELRKLAIVNNYRALVDNTAGGGFGTLYGPNVSPEGVAGSVSKACGSVGAV